MHHLFWTCSAWSSIRQDFFQRWSNITTLTLDTHSQLALHGLAIEDNDLLNWRKNSYLPEWPYCSRPFPIWLGDGDASHDENCRLIVYTDGACKHQADDRLRSAGCGIFVSPGHPWNSSFPLPGVAQSSDLAELRALVHAVEGATAQNIDVIVKLDNAYVADQASAILAGATSWPACGHALWRRLAIAQAEQLASGSSGHAAAWIKGHSTAEDVALGIISPEDRCGNQAADRLASSAASVHSCPEDIIERAKVRKVLTALVQTYLVEVLLSRRLVLIEKHSIQPEDSLQPLTGLPSPPPSPPPYQAIQSAFIALHSYSVEFITS